jgi:hypothetical protein
MLSAIPLTIIPLVLFNVIGFAAGGEPWGNVLFAIPLISGKAWNVTLADAMILIALVLLFFEILRSASPARGATVANHIVSTVVLLVYVIEFITTPAAASSLFFVLTAIALFDVVAGFTISIRTAQRDFSIGHGGGLDSPV